MVVVGQQVETFGIQFQPQIVRRDVTTTIDAAFEVKTGIFSAHTLMPLLFWLVRRGRIIMRGRTICVF